MSTITKFILPNIANIKYNNSLDYPGLLCDTVFLYGCNLRCDYCQNTWLQSYKDHNLIEAIETTKRVLHLVTKTDSLSKAVVFSGGEPSFYFSFCNLLLNIKNITRRKIGLQTNGIPKNLNIIISKSLVDFIQLDYKLFPLNDIEEISRNENIELLIKSKIQFLISFTHHGTEKDMMKIAEIKEKYNLPDSQIKLQNIRKIDKGNCSKSKSIPDIFYKKELKSSINYISNKITKLDTITDLQLTEAEYIQQLLTYIEDLIKNNKL